MELLLNLAWLALALPAYWLWRSRAASRGRAFTALQCLLALGCMLVVLFPVVSATDDLRALRSEMEESPASKRTIRQTTSDRNSGWKWQSPPALAVTASFPIISDQSSLPLPAPVLKVPVAPSLQRPARAPPRFFPG